MNLKQSQIDALSTVLVNQKFAPDYAVKLRDEIVSAIHNAEGFPVGSGDKYIDAKAEIVSTINKLNQSIFDADKLGLTCEISIFNTISSDVKPFFTIVLGKVYKEF